MLNIFDNWASDETKTANDLAKQTAAEELLIGTLSLVVIEISSPLCPYT